MNSIAAVILAAGTSSRLGYPKQLVEFQSETLLERAARIAQQAGLSPVLVVLGANAEHIKARCALGAARVIDNPHWQQGMASSICAGVSALIESTAAGVLIVACDQPSVHAEHLQKLAAQPHRLMASSYAGRRGIPAYFPRYLFANLLLLTGDAGAKQILSAADSIELPGGEFDIDTPAACVALQNQIPTSGPA